MSKERRGAVLRRALVGATAALFLTCHAEANPPVGAPAAVSPSSSGVGAEQPARFDPSVVAPLAGSSLATARAAMGSSPSETRALGAAHPQDAELRWMEALAAAAQDDEVAAEAAWVAVGETTHALAPWGQLKAARAALARDPAVAAARARALLEAGTQFPGRSDAAALEALALAAAQDEGAEAALRAALEGATGGTERELQETLASMLAAREEVEAREEALQIERALAARWPAYRAGRAAAERAETILASLPRERRDALRPVSAQLEEARADALSAAMQHRDAETAYAALARRLAEDPAGRCRAQLGQGRSLYRRRARREAAALLAQVAERCREQDDTRGWARYFAAKSYSGIGQYEEAIAQYDVLAEELPGHRLADDALVLASILSREHGDEAGAVSRLEQAVRDHQRGDMHGEARFLLAWQRRRAGDAQGALEVLDAALAQGPGETGEDERGRAAYWRARLLAELGRNAEAADAFAALAQALPLSYYAQLAVGRLRSVDAARADAALPARSAQAAAQISFALRPELESAAFTRAIALLRVGEIDLALSELEQAGLYGESADPEALWLVAALLDRAGEPSRALELARRRLRDVLMTTAPEGDALSRWRIAFPHAYAPLIDEVAEAEGVPAPFVRAIAREESSFRPDAVSIANAYGLLQIIRPTAQRIARPLGLPSDADALRRPEVNVRIGARYMARLRTRFEDNPALVPAAYNAGEGAVERWLREGDSTRELDEFIEEIPYAETRRYSRRVLQSWGIYSFLDEGTLPSLPRALPVR